MAVSGSFGAPSVSGFTAVPNAACAANQPDDAVSRRSGNYAPSHSTHTESAVSAIVIGLIVMFLSIYLLNSFIL